jgi:hypothetical protein
LEENAEEDLDDMEVDVGIEELGVLVGSRNVVEWDDDDEERENGVLNVVGYDVGLGLPHHLDKSIVSARSSALDESEDASVAVVVDNEVRDVVVVLVKVENEVEVHSGLVIRIGSDDDDDEVDDLLVECCELGFTCAVVFRELFLCLDI